MEKQAVVVRKLKALPIEAIVRGYLVGSGWKEYQKSGTVCGIQLPAGLKEATNCPSRFSRRPPRRRSASMTRTSALKKAAALLGRDMAEKVKQATITIYKDCAAYALTKGIIIADTKFEFGLTSRARSRSFDEVLTPDSSRFWPADQYKPGANPPSFDKQYVRDWLEASAGTKRPRRRSCRRKLSPKPRRNTARRLYALPLKV